MGKEPSILARGKAFHKRVQEDWRIDAEGTVHPEHTIPLLGISSLRRQKRGRIDLFVDDVGECIVVVEIKSTDWDRILPKNRRRLVGRHWRQVWRYIDTYLMQGKQDIVPGIIYPREPSNVAVRDEIVDLLNDHGIQVVWYEDLPAEPAESVED